MAHSNTYCNRACTARGYFQANDPLTLTLRPILGHQVMIGESIFELEHVTWFAIMTQKALKGSCQRSCVESHEIRRRVDAKALNVHAQG